MNDDFSDSVTATGLLVDRRRLIRAAGLIAASAPLSAAVNAGAAKSPAPLSPARPGARVMPHSFLWGAATSGHQVEGNNINSDAWLMENTKPSLFEERSGDANDSYDRYKEDIDLVKSIGLNSYRFSLEWSRIEPTEGYFSNAALDHYKYMIDYCHKLGIRPAVTFNHYTVPVWFAVSGGFKRADGPDLFARYCLHAAKHLADGMHMGFTLNEPEAARINDMIFMEPVKPEILAALKKSTGSNQFECWRTLADEAGLQALVAAHKQGYAAIKSIRGDLPVGVCLALIDYRGVGPNNIAAKMREFIETPWLEAAKTGDFVAVQNYWPVYIDDKGVTSPPEGVLTNRWGLHIDPSSLANVVYWAHQSTGKPILISEHGIDTDDDAQRIWHMTESLKQLGAMVAKENIPLLGYIHWALLDNFEWGSYTPRFGLVAVDRVTFARSPKPSAYALGALAKRNLL